MTATSSTATITKTGKPSSVARRALTVQQSKVSGSELCSTTLSKKFKKRVCTVDGDVGVLPVILTKQNQSKFASSVQNNQDCSALYVVNLSKEPSYSCVKVKTQNMFVAPNGGISPNASFEDNRPITPFLDTSTPTDCINTFCWKTDSAKCFQGPAAALDSVLPKKRPFEHKKKTRSLRVHKDLKSVIECTQNNGSNFESPSDISVTTTVQKTCKSIRAGLSKKIRVPSLHPNIKRNPH